MNFAYSVKVDLSLDAFYHKTNWPRETISSKNRGIELQGEIMFLLIFDPSSLLKSIISLYSCSEILDLDNDS